MWTSDDEERLLKKAEKEYARYMRKGKLTREETFNAIVLSENIEKSKENLKMLRQAEENRRIRWSELCDRDSVRYSVQPEYQNDIKIVEGREYDPPVTYHWSNYAMAVAFCIAAVLPGIMWLYRWVTN